MSEKTVGTGQIEIGRESDVLDALGIGSCVVVCLYDKQNKIGGLAHIMLPESKRDENDNMNGESAPAEFVSSGIDALVNIMRENGAEVEKLVAKIAGGSEMFEGIRTTPISLGVQNVNAAKQKLNEMGINIISEDVGGNVGRSIRFFIDEGDVEIRKRM